MKKSKIKECSAWVRIQWSERVAAEIVIADKPHVKLAELKLACLQQDEVEFDYKGTKYLIKLSAWRYTSVRKRVDELCSYFIQNEQEQMVLPGM